MNKKDAALMAIEALKRGDVILYLSTDETMQNDMLHKQFELLNLLKTFIEKNVQVK